MKTRTRLALIAVAAAVAAMSVPEPAASDEVVMWKKVGEWSVAVDTTMGHGCFMAAKVVPGETVVRVGIDARALPPRPYVVIGNPEWAPTLKTYPLTMRIDNDTAGVTAKAGAAGGVPTLGFHIAPALFSRLMTGRVLAVAVGSTLLVHTKLDGTHAAGAEVLRCQEAMIEAGASGRPAAAKGMVS